MKFLDEWVKFDVLSLVTHTHLSSKLKQQFSFTQVVFIFQIETGK